MGTISGYTCNQWKGLYATISAKIPKVGQFIYCSDRDWFVIGDGVTTVSNLKQYRIDENDAISANKVYTSADNYRNIFMTTGATDRTVTLPSASTVAAQTYFIKKIDSGTGKVTINATAGNIEGASSYELSGQYDSITLVSDGTNYFIKTSPGAGGAIVEVTLAETVTALKAIAYNTSGTGILGDITDSSKINIAGISLTGGSATDVIECQKIGELVSASHGFTLGVQYYLGSSGNPVTKANVPGNVPSIPLFIPRDANTLDVNIGQLEARIEDIQQYPIGHVTYSYNPDAPAGYLRFEFDNEVLKTQYPDLWDKVGSAFAAEHTAAGETLTSSDYFWPSPIPGGYSRAAVSLDITVSSVDTGTERMTIPTADYNRLNALRGSGLPIKLTVVSGTLTGGLTAETEYFIGFISSGIISFYNSEANAISDTSPVNLTDTNTGTYTFHQTGIDLDDAVGEHEHTIDAILNATGGTSNSTLSNTGSGTRDNNVTIGIESGNTTNETRPKTNYQYAFIKAVNIDVSSGQAITALKYDSGYINITDWTNVQLNINHGLNESDTGNLIIKILLSSDGTDANQHEAYYGQYTVAATNAFGFQIEPVDANNLQLQTGQNGIVYLTGTGGITTLGGASSYYYRVIVYKPQFTTKVYEPKVFTYDLSSGSLVHTLPDATNYMGQITIKATGGTFGVNNLTINTVASQTIDGYSNYIIEVDNIITLESDSSNWLITNIRKPIRLVMQRQESTGVNAGTNIQNAWTARIINTTVENNIPGSSLSSNQITLPAGEYVIDSNCTFYRTDETDTRLYDTTNTVSKASAINLFLSQTASGSTASSEIKRQKFTLTGTAVLELQYYCKNAQTTYGLGIAKNISGQSEIYLNIEIEKIA